jgi:hypothetical protein
VTAWLRAALTGAWLGAQLSLLAAPDIESISPLGLRPGQSTPLTLSGSALSDATQLWTSFPASVESLGGGRFRIVTDASVGIGAVRAFGSNGVSNLGFVLLDDLPGAAEWRTNKSRATAQPIAFGSAVDGRAEELSYDWFKVRLQKGQRLSVETVAARLGSRLDSVLRIADASGRERARNDDAPGLHGDSYLNFTAADAGEYFIELRDVNYGGGVSFFYHLRCGDFPLATTAFPAASSAGDKQVVQLLGPAGVVGRVTRTNRTNAVLASVAVEGRAGSAFARLVPGAGREVFEREPNNTAARATKVSLTDGINGRFDAARDRDVYEFTAAKGSRIEWRAATRSLGSPCDVLMRLENPAGKALARSNPSAADEGVLTHSFGTNGTYRLIVEEAGAGTGSNLIYRIISQPAAGFGVMLDTDRVHAAPGKNFELKATTTRGDYKGPVTLALDGLPGAVLTNNVIAEGKSNVTMRVTIPETLAPATWTTFSVIGTSKNAERGERVRATTAPALRKQLPLLLQPLPDFDGVVVLGVTGPG